MDHSNQKRSDASFIDSVIDALSYRSKKLGKKLKLKKPPRQKSILGLQRNYYRDLLKLVDAMTFSVSSNVIPALFNIIELAKSSKPTTDSLRKDDYPDEIDNAIERAKVEFYGEYTDEQIQTIVVKHGFAIEEAQLAYFKDMFKTVLGIDYRNFEPFIQTEIEAFTKANVKLIKTIPSQYFEKIDQVITDGVRFGTLTKDIERQIISKVRKEGKKAKNRAKVIARDQVSKFNGSLNQVRQTSVGIKQYEWLTSMDERVRGNPTGKYPKARPSHWHREGQIFDWNNPPEDGHPGEAIMCRCTASPVIKF